MPWRNTIVGRLPEPVSQAVIRLSSKRASMLREIRAHIGAAYCFVYDDGKETWGKPLTDEEMDHLVNALCGYARYAYEETMAQGYVPLEGGHRVGICGRIVWQDRNKRSMVGVKSVCIRIARRISGASGPIRPYLMRGGIPARVLVMGPPGCGKTTVLRDAAEYLAGDCGLHVAVADEREELFPDGSSGMDVMTGMSKGDAMDMLMRSMAPQVLVCDELSTLEDANAVLGAGACGVGVLASAHANGLQDLLRKPALSRLFHDRGFDSYLLLGKNGICLKSWTGDGKEVLCGE